MNVFGILRRERRGVDIAVDSTEHPVRMVGGKELRGRPQNKHFTVDIWLDIDRCSPCKQSQLGVWNTARGVQVVEGENRVLSQVERRSVFKLDLRAPVAGYQAEAGFQRQIGNRLLPCIAGRFFVLLASRNAYVALDIA